MHTSGQWKLQLSGGQCRRLAAGWLRSGWKEEVFMARFYCRWKQAKLWISVTIKVFRGGRGLTWPQKWFTVMSTSDYSTFPLKRKWCREGWFELLLIRSRLLLWVAAHNAHVVEGYVCTITILYKVLILVPSILNIIFRFHFSSCCIMYLIDTKLIKWYLFWPAEQDNF